MGIPQTGTVYAFSHFLEQARRRPSKSEASAMLEQVIRRYGPQLLQEPQRLRQLVEYRCHKDGISAPAPEYWVPFEHGWLLGWPQKGSQAFLDSYRQVRTNSIRKAGGQSLERELELLPAAQTLVVKSSQLEIGSRPGCQSSLSEALLRVDRSGMLILEESQRLTGPLQEGELHLVGAEGAKVQLDLAQSTWPGGWLRLENLALSGTLEIQGGLVELYSCQLNQEATIKLTAPGACLFVDDGELLGCVEGDSGSVVVVRNSNWEVAATALKSAGVVNLQGVALTGHSQNGLYLWGRGRAAMEDCQVRDCMVGIRCEDHSRIWLQQCWLRGNLQLGLGAKQEAAVEIQASHFRDNRGDGLLLTDWSRGNVRLCNFQGQGGAAIRVNAQVILEQVGNEMSLNRGGDIVS